MIGCEVSGGLGNQFFRYAFTRNLLHERNNIGKKDNLLINFGATEDHGVEGDLSDFNIAEHKKYKCRRIILKKGSILQISVFFILTRLERIASKFNISLNANVKYKILGLLGIIISENPDNEKLFFNKNKNNLFVIGSFENINYFNGIKDILCKEFTPIHKELPHNKNLYNIIRTKNSICLAVRRGDFMKEENKKIFYVCDLQYFQSAIDYMQKTINNPTFIVFSNDLEWAKENLKIDGDVFYESGNDPVWETYRLMYSCKHFIISNSTLHWWAQYKASYPGKIVVAPDRWYNASGWENHLMLEYFVRISTGVERIIH